MNECDLEEVKHMAFQKFLELAKEPNKWTKNSKVFWWHNLYTLGDFTISINKNVSVCVRLGGEELLRYNLLSDQNVSSVAPYHKAIDDIVEFFEQQEKREKCERLQLALKESCNSIQKSLENLDKPKSRWKFWK